MAAHGPDMDMTPAEDLQEGSAALEGAVEASAATGFEEPHGGDLRKVIGKRWSAFRRAPRVSNLCWCPVKAIDRACTTLSMVGCVYGFAEEWEIFA